MRSSVAGFSSQITSLAPTNTNKLQKKSWVFCSFVFYSIGYVLNYWGCGQGAPEWPFLELGLQKHLWRHRGQTQQGLEKYLEFLWRIVADTLCRIWTWHFGSIHFKSGFWRPSLHCQWPLGQYNQPRRQVFSGVHFLFDVLSSWADQGSCAHKCVC